MNMDFLQSVDHDAVEGRAMRRLMEWADHPWGHFVIDTHGENKIQAWAKRPDGTKVSGVGMTVAEAVERALR